MFHFLEREDLVFVELKAVACCPPLSWEQSRCIFRTIFRSEFRSFGIPFGCWLVEMLFLVSVLVWTNFVGRGLIHCWWRCGQWRFRENSASLKRRWLFHLLCGQFTVGL